MVHAGLVFDLGPVFGRFSTNHCERKTRYTLAAGSTSSCLTCSSSPAAAASSSTAENARFPSWLMLAIVLGSTLCRQNLNMPAPKVSSPGLSDLEATLSANARMARATVAGLVPGVAAPSPSLPSAKPVRKPVALEANLKSQIDRTNKRNFAAAASSSAPSDGKDAKKAKWIEEARQRKQKEEEDQDSRANVVVGKAAGTTAAAKPKKAAKTAAAAPAKKEKEQEKEQEKAKEDESDDVWASNWDGDDKDDVAQEDGAAAGAESSRIRVQTLDLSKPLIPVTAQEAASAAAAADKEDADEEEEKTSANDGGEEGTKRAYLPKWKRPGAKRRTRSRQKNLKKDTRPDEKVDKIKWAFWGGFLTHKITTRNPRT